MSASAQVYVSAVFVSGQMNGGGGGGGGGEKKLVIRRGTKPPLKLKRKDCIDGLAAKRIDQFHLDGTNVSAFSFILSNRTYRHPT